MHQFNVRVTSKANEAVDIASFELTSVDGSQLPPFSAGAHIDVHIKEGLVRQYSLCNAPSEQHRYVIGVLRDPQSRGGSVAMHEQIAEGDILQISEPRNHFSLNSAKRSLLLGGGIGVTPLLCMAEQLSQSGAQFSMHYCARSPDRMAFRERIAKSSFADHVKLHFDDGPAEQKLDLPGLLAGQEEGAHIYVCGPAGFIDYVTNTARSLGWPDEQVYLEHFGARPIDTSSDSSFEVKLASSGKIYTVPANTSIASVLQENGVDVQLSCEQGICGACITRVLDGEPDHRDQCLTEEEKKRNNQLTICCSRAKSKQLVLAL